MSTIDRLISDLELKPHPEGGWYREVFRSNLTVQPADDRATRCALTTIYFLLARGQVSRMHRVRSDEVWHFYEGAPIRLITCGGNLEDVTEVTLGQVGETSRRVHAVPAGVWQAAQSLGDYSLVGCSVGPGFDFADFTMLEDDQAVATRFQILHPELGAFARLRSR